MGSQRLAFWLRKLGWRNKPFQREPDPIEMGTAFGLDASMDPAEDDKPEVRPVRVIKDRLQGAARTSRA